MCFNNEVLDKLIKWNVSNSDSADKELPAILFGKNEGYKRGLVLKFFIVKLYMIGEPKATLSEYFKNGSVSPYGNEEFSMSRNTFRQMHGRFHFPIQLFSLFNDVFVSLVKKTGRFVCFDEKKKSCQPNYKYARCIKKKWCHWICQSSVVAPISRMPYVMQLIPLTYVPAREFVDEPFNNLTVHEAVLLAEKECSKNSTIVFDSHYMDYTCFRELLNKKRRFIAKANPTWWSQIVEAAEPHLGKEKGDYALLWSKKLECHFMIYNSMNPNGKMKRKCVLTNAFVNKAIGEKEKYHDVNVIQKCYNEEFGTNDDFNQYLHKRYFPIEQRSGWQSNYTDFLFASYQMNLYTIYHEINGLTLENKIPRSNFNRLFAQELMSMVKTSENRDWKDLRRDSV